jgi:asparagine synthase (glutamine-hydrolysing)
VAPTVRDTRIGGVIGLCHARLSIIIFAGGAQPMCSEDRTVWVVFNGEIFNYIELRRECCAGTSFHTESIPSPGAPLRSSMATGLSTI